ncbi:MAG: glycosyltransferase family 2 protein [Desulfovibrio sp.]|jgi:GT2 family glycosyltransferase|nr:glycosyltransferase family 2 protein [Desulfovibrio sp.]
MSVCAATTTVILLNYRGAEDTLACLKSLRVLATAPQRIVIVDNASGDGSLEALQAWLEQEAGNASGGAAANRPTQVPPGQKTQYVLLPLAENNGYASGNNAGIRLALQDSACSAVWLVNNDTQVKPHALDALCRSLSEKPEAGAAGSTLVFAGSEVIQCLGGQSVSPFLGSTKAILEFSRLDEGLLLAPEDVNARIDFTTGASMLVRRETFERVGLLSEEYFLYYEDVEFGIRIKKAGLGLVWSPESIVYHKGGPRKEANREIPRWVDYLILRNRIYFMRRHYLWSLPLALCGYGGVLLNRIRRNQADRLPLVFHALRDGLRGEMGLSRAAKRLMARDLA